MAPLDPPVSRSLIVNSFNLPDNGRIEYISKLMICPSYNELLNELRKVEIVAKSTENTFAIATGKPPWKQAIGK